MTDLAAVLAGARLDGIDVVRCLWERDHPSFLGPLRYDAQLTQRLNIVVNQPEVMPAGGAAFLVVMSVVWEEATASNAVARAEVQLRVTYGFADTSLILSRELGDEFGQKIAQHHAWPFLRHRLQLLCMELGINPVLLPLKPLTPAPTEAAAKPST